MFLDVIPVGSYGRWAVGLIVLTHVLAYNETGSITVLFASIIATVCGVLSGICKSSLNHLQLPYIRTTHKFDFFILFLALWMDILTLICACGALARTMSICLDAMTGGMARIYILGRNAPINEPWPDVIGFSIIFLVSVMFMLGLENSKIFACILVASLTGVMCILVTIASIRGTVTSWQTQPWLPKSFYGLLYSAALLVFICPAEVPATGSYRRLVGAVICAFVCLTCIIAMGCLSLFLQYSPPEDFIAVPIMSILETTDFHNLEPAAACLLVLTCSCAFLELFPEMYNLLVALTTSDWKILSRQIGYENGDSGSPVLAIFTGGSICAMIAFACPMEFIIYLIAGSQLSASIIRAFYLFYSPFRPKCTATSQNDSALSYSRLDTSGVKPSQSAVSLATTTASTAAGVSRRIFRCLSTPKLIVSSRAKRNKHNNEEVEREWLLLGEPQSPRSTILFDDVQDTSTLSLAIAEAAPNNNGESACSPDVSHKETSSVDSDSSTDIDAIVDEYRQKVKVTSAGTKEKIMRLPSDESWKVSIVCVTVTCIGAMVSVIGIAADSIIALGTGAIVVLIFNFIMCILPRYNHSQNSPSALFCSLAILLESILFGSIFFYSWPAILAWIIAGILIFTRCDTWCTLCIEQPIYINHIISPSLATASRHIPTMRLPRSAKGTGALIGTRVHGQCR